MDSAVIGGLLGIIAVLFGGLFGIYLPRRNARRDAGQRLIAEFAAVSASFDKIATSNIHAIDPVLREAYPRLEEKINIFKRHLFWRWEKRGFRKTWIAYYNDRGDERCQSYDHYMAFGSNPNYRENFKHNVDNLLKYAKQK
jgi:hypothetical protein